MRRREFIASIGATAIASPFVAFGQQSSGKVWRVGILISGAADDPQALTFLAAFRAELEKLGWAEPVNLRIETRWTAPADPESGQRFATELVALRPDVIVSNTTPPTAALLRQTRTIPIVFVSVNDPIGSGFVESFTRPGGNATGFVILEPTLGGKWLELLKEIAPRLARVAFLFNPAQAPTAVYYLNSLKAAAESLGLEAISAPVRDVSEIESVMMKQGGPTNGGLVMAPDGFLVAHRVEIISMAAKYRLPAVYPFRLFAEVGGLLSYGADLPNEWRRAASYVDRILKGVNPGELPVQAPVKFELVINLKTARALGVDVPPTVLSRADELIE